MLKVTGHFFGDTIISELQKDGTYIHKANPHPNPRKKNGNLKAHYHDMPRFNIVNEIEDEAKTGYDQVITHSVRQIANHLINVAAK